ncbi:MAG TPA: hypothetical protein VNQ76_22575 [Planctomicrobium sp.]|nr:hypothetical protein [Planctomicrobium sp.]
MLSALVINCSSGCATYYGAYCLFGNHYKDGDQNHFDSYDDYKTNVEKWEQ